MMTQRFGILGGVAMTAVVRKLTYREP